MKKPSGVSGGHQAHTPFGGVCATGVRGWSASSGAQYARCRAACQRTIRRKTEVGRRKGPMSAGAVALADEAAGGSLQAEFVPLGVLHDDPVFTPFFSRPEVSGAECGQPIGLCIDFLSSLLDRTAETAADVEVEVDPVLGDLRLGDLLDEDPRAGAVGGRSVRKRRSNGPRGCPICGATLPSSRSPPVAGPRRIREPPPRTGQAPPGLPRQRSLGSQPPSLPPVDSTSGTMLA